jgi:hypothetical protein
MLAPVPLRVRRTPRRSSIEDLFPNPKGDPEMPNIASIIRDQVTLSTRCVDRLYLNGYLPKLQAPQQVRWFLGGHLGKPVVSPAVFGPLHDRFVAAVRSFAKERQIPVVRFERRQRKDDVAAGHRRRFNKPEGGVLLGVAQERATSFRGQKQVGPGGRVDFTFSRRSVYVNHFYFYFQDRQLPALSGQAVPQWPRVGQAAAAAREDRL